MNAPDPKTVTPHEGAPRFFRRVWDPGIYDTGGNQWGMPVIQIAMEPITIYGYAAMSPYIEDHEVEERVWARGDFGAWCFSVAEVNGEWGFTPLEDVEEISEEEFNAARERGFQ
jgi:hypothetical protein